MTEKRLDVAIIGFGPTGATLANALGLVGLDVAVIERETDLLPLPRAVHFDGEVMRIFQGLGLSGAIEHMVRPSGGMRYVGTDGTILVERKAATTPGIHGWLDNYLFHQPDLERTLRAGVAMFPRVQTMLGQDVTAIEQDSREVRLTVVDAHGAARTLQARYVIGCDGARSLARDAIGSEHDDLGLHQPWLVVDVRLRRAVNLPEATTQYCDPSRPTTYVHGTGLRRRWEIMLMPGDTVERMQQPDRVWELLAPWLTPADAELERSAVYTFHSLIAKRWRDRRVLIAGDAAHQTPPFLGQGMCAGIRDAANLAWKLERVLDGRAPQTLLDTYQSERAPHVKHFIDLAVRLGDIIQTTDPAVAAERDRRFAAGGTQTMVNLSPQLGPGFHEGSAPAGETFPQVHLADGTWSDDRIGHHFALIAPGFSDPCPAELRVINESSPAIEAWLKAHHAIAVVVRPDRYVYAIAQTHGDIAGLIQRTTEAPHESHPAAINHLG